MYDIRRTLILVLVAVLIIGMIVPVALCKDEDKDKDKDKDTTVKDNPSQDKDKDKDQDKDKDKDPKPDPTLLISPAEVTLKIGETCQFKMSLENGNGAVLSNLNWRVTGNVGEINQSGLFKAGNKAKRGAVIVTGKVDNKNLAATAQINVAEGETPPGPSKKINVIINPSSIDLSPGGYAQFFVDSMPEGAKVEWRIVPSRIGTINQSGFIRAAQVAGKGMVIATVSTDDAKGTGKADVVVASTKEQSNKLKLDLDVKPEYAKVNKVQSVKLQAIIKGTKQTDDYSIVWNVEPAIGTISATDSKKEQVTFTAGQTEGKALITASATIDSVSYNDWAIVEITGDEKTQTGKFKVTVSPDSATLGVGDIKTFTANVIGASPEPPVNWSWSIAPKKLGYLTIVDNKTASFEALESGWGMLIAKADDGKSLGVGQAKIYVSGKGKEQLRYRISPQYATAQAGGNPLMFTLINENGEPINGPISWKVVPEKMGALNGNGESATFTPGGTPGQVMITAKVQGLMTVQARLTITEQNAYGKLIATVDGQQNLKVGNTYTYTVTVTKSSGEPVNLAGAQIDWRVVPSRLATISGAGDTATIAATNKGLGVVLVAVKTTQGTVTGKLSIAVEK